MIHFDIMPFRAVLGRYVDALSESFEAPYPSLGFAWLGPSYVLMPPISVGLQGKAVPRRLRHLAIYMQTVYSRLTLKVKFTFSICRIALLRDALTN